ncbi:5-oxoprolinase subunit PxpB [Agrobacterium vitis]|nr:5-oxoprolinase subunit PxpB [Agrobacterium vitis]MCM2442849.1 5-oxoprolinase subunit PxpB [Agrobacterium vitis]
MYMKTLKHSAVIASSTANMPKVSSIGTKAFVVDAPGAFDLASQRRIWALSAMVQDWPDVQETVPGMTNLLLVLHHTPEDHEAIKHRLLEAWNTAQGMDLTGKTVEIPVTYGGEHATDLPALCDLSGLSDRDIVKIHAAGTYTVFALGSAPGFGYLHGLDPRIHMPRKTVPSLNMARGCLTIGGMQTGVAVLTGPNGWNSIGFAEMPMFDPMAASPALLAPGDTVRFIAERIEL